MERWSQPVTIGRKSDPRGQPQEQAKTSPQVATSRPKERMRRIPRPLSPRGTREDDNNPGHPISPRTTKAESLTRHDRSAGRRPSLRRGSSRSRRTVMTRPNCRASARVSATFLHRAVPRIAVRTRTAGQAARRLRLTCRRGVRSSAQSRAHRTAASRAAPREPNDGRRVPAIEVAKVIRYSTPNPQRDPSLWAHRGLLSSGHVPTAVRAAAGKRSGLGRSTRNAPSSRAAATTAA
jgi:hypothetical protein